MKRLITLSLISLWLLPMMAQVSDIRIELGGDLWRLGHTVSSTQINCGLCPQIVEEIPSAQQIISSLQDSILVERYTRKSLSFTVSAALFSPAFRTGLQVGPSMRSPEKAGPMIGSQYSNRNISMFLGLNPMQFSQFAGRYYLGAKQKLFLDLSELGVFLQFSNDGGFEEYVRSTNNMAVMVRWQPTFWLNDQRRFGIALRGSAREWLLGNRNEAGPFNDARGLPRKVKPHWDWSFGAAILIAPF